jgi:hydroxymethylglutaryl-CoA lyase
MQGIKPFIPTERKVAYIQSLLRVGFDSIDFEFCLAKSDSANAGYRCCAWAIDLSQTKANYWLLPIPEEHKWLRSMLKFNI